MSDLDKQGLRVLFSNRGHPMPGLSPAAQLGQVQAKAGPEVLALLSGGGGVSTLTIRQIDDRTHARLRGRAAKHGRSVEAEVRAILDAAVDLPEENVLLALHASVAEVGGIDLALVPRTDRPRSVELS